MICGSENVCPLFPPRAHALPPHPTWQGKKKETAMDTPTQSGSPISSDRAAKTPKVERSQGNPSPPNTSSSQPARNSAPPAGLPGLAIVPYNEAREVAPIPVPFNADDMLVSDGSDDECDGHGWLRAPKDLVWPQKVRNIYRTLAPIRGRRPTAMGDPLSARSLLIRETEKQWCTWASE